MSHLGSTDMWRVRSGRISLMTSGREKKEVDNDRGALLSPYNPKAHGLDFLLGHMGKEVPVI